MTETTKKNWKSAGLGDLPPMVHMDIGDVVVGVVDDVRDVKRKDSKKKKTQIGLHINLTEKTTVATGSRKKKPPTYKRVDFEAGKKLCLTVGGNLSTLLKDFILKETGEDLSKIASEDMTAANVRPLKGREIRVVRLDDGEMQEGEFKGNPVKRFTLDYAEAPSA